MRPNINSDVSRKITDLLDVIGETKGKEKVAYSLLKIFFLKKMKQVASHYGLLTRKERKKSTKKRKLKNRS